jgi:hypothetical protein
VASILTLQFIFLLPISASLTFQVSDVLLFSAVFGLTALLGLYIKPLLLAEQKNTALEIENLSLRRNHNLFLPYYNALD